MSSSPFLGAKFANGKHNSEFTIQTRGNEFAPISGTFFIAFWKCRPRAQHLPLIEDPHEIFNKNKSMRNFPSELGNQFLQNVWQLKILSKKYGECYWLFWKTKLNQLRGALTIFCGQCQKMLLLMKGYDDKSTKKERPEQTNVLDSAERKLKPSREKSAVFFNIVQKAFHPPHPPPLRMWWIFLKEF